jgi:D-alanyl-D-alanine carboxypeptidase
MLAMTVGMHPVAASAADDELAKLLAGYAGSRVPGLQYVVVDADGIVFEYAGGWADVANRKPMTPDSTLMAYSMTKTFTAVAILQLAEQGRLSLDDPIDRHLPAQLYGGHGITVRQLLMHTSGVPNPIPLRWVHLAEERDGFDEAAALDKVVRANPDLSFEPGRGYGYSNIGYWLLGRLVEVPQGSRTSLASFSRSGLPRRSSALSLPIRRGRPMVISCAFR